MGILVLKRLISYNTSGCIYASIFRLAGLGLASDLLRPGFHNRVNFLEKDHEVRREEGGGGLKINSIYHTILSKIS